MVLQEELCSMEIVKIYIKFKVKNIQSKHKYLALNVISYMFQLEYKGIISLITKTKKKSQPHYFCFCCNQPDNGYIF